MQAVAKQEADTVHLGLQQARLPSLSELERPFSGLNAWWCQVSLLGQEAVRAPTDLAKEMLRIAAVGRAFLQVQDLLSCRDEQGDSLLHLAVAGARHEKWILLAVADLVEPFAPDGLGGIVPPQLPLPAFKLWAIQGNSCLDLIALLKFLKVSPGSR